MISEHIRPDANVPRDPHSPLSEIETLLDRARAGEISEGSALSRIVVLARGATAGDTYQKPLG